MRIVTKPLIIVYREEDATRIEIWPPEDEHYGFEAYGLLIADVIRNVAAAFNVPEQSVFDWVKKEMKKPTTTYEAAQRLPGETKQ